MDETDLTGDERWEVLARYVAGESTPGEVERVRRWLDEDPRRMELVSALGRTVGKVAAPAAEVDVEAALARVGQRLAEPDVRPIGSARPRERRSVAWRTIMARAATVAAIVIGGTLVFRGLRHQPEVAPGLTQRSFATSVGEIDSVRLTDGTRVVLGPDSRLELAEDYATSRAVVLRGEAFFAVVHDDARPFTVHAGDAVIRDLGTAFSVRTAADGVRVVVTEGSVVLRERSARDSAVLRAGDRGTIARGVVTAQTGAAAPEDLAWTSGRLVFDHTPLTQVAAELRRWYGVELRVPQDADRHVTASFESEDVDQVLNVIGLVLGARIERIGDTAFVRLPETP